MQSIEELRAENRRIAGQIVRLRGVAAAGVPDGAAVALLSWELVSALADQRVRVDRALCRPMLATSDTLAVRAAWGYRQNQAALQDALLRFVASWPVARLKAEWPGFASAVEAALAPIEDQLAWDERELFGHAERILSRRAA